MHRSLISVAKRSSDYSFSVLLHLINCKKAFKTDVPETIQPDIKHWLISSIIYFIKSLLIDIITIIVENFYDRKLSQELIVKLLSNKYYYLSNGSNSRAQSGKCQVG